MKTPFNTLTMTRFGQMLVNINDVYIGKSLLTYGEYSWGEIELFRQLLPRDAVVVEAGSNIGSHTVPLSQSVSEGGSVYAFEPQRIVFQTLCANVALNSCDNVYCYWAGVDENNNKGIKMPDLSPYVTNNFGGVNANQTHDESIALEVPCLSIDSLSLSRCDLIKVDVEGMEEGVIKSADHTIKNCRPAIYFEADRREKLPAVIRLVQSYGYKMWWHIPSLFNPKNYYGVERDIFNVVSINILATPSERQMNVVNFREVKDENDWWM